jgi:hypothetical protein
MVLVFLFRLLASICGEPLANQVESGAAYARNLSQFASAICVNEVGHLVEAVRSETASDGGAKRCRDGE